MVRWDFLAPEIEALLQPMRANFGFKLCSFHVLRLHGLVPTLNVDFRTSLGWGRRERTGEERTGKGQQRRGEDSRGEEKAVEERRGEREFSTDTEVPHDVTIGWALLKTSSWSPLNACWPSFVFPWFLLALGLSWLSLAASPALIFSLHWLVSTLSIVRISCSLSWHSFLNETFPSLVHAKEFLP